jgi:hypothetical protein
MGVPSPRVQATNRYDFKRKLGLAAALAIIVIVNVGDVSASDSSANEQYLFHQEYERLHKQIKPQTYSLQDQIASNQQYSRRTPVYQPPQFNTANVPNRGEHHFSVQHQEQRQEQVHHHQQQRTLEIENTKYSIWSQNMTYVSSTGYNAMGMMPLYNLTNKFIDFFVDKEEPIPPGQLSLILMHGCHSHTHTHARKRDDKAKKERNVN